MNVHQTIIPGWIKGDAENAMSPSRKARLMRRLAAEKRIADRANELAIARATGVLPVGSSGHRINARPTRGELYRGILFADGEVHTWKEQKLHVSYAREVGRPDIESGASRGTQGWGFYVKEDGIQAWMLPEQFVAQVEAVLGYAPKPERSSIEAVAPVARPVRPPRPARPEIRIGTRPAASARSAAARKAAQTRKFNARFGPPARPASSSARSEAARKAAATRRRRKAMGWY